MSVYVTVVNYAVTTNVMITQARGNFFFFETPQAYGYKTFFKSNI